LLAFPIVDMKRRMIGIVDVGLYTEGLTELEDAQRGDDLFQLIGVHLTESHQADPVAAFRSRFPWLICNIVGGIIAAFISGIFSAEFERVVALALFVPVVLGLAESVSIQSVSLTLQVLHGQKPSPEMLWQRMKRELLTGLLLGSVSAAVVATVSIVWLHNYRVALCLLVGIGGGMTAAALIGVAMPNLLRILRRNPQVAAGPIALAMADMLTLVVYFSLARLIT
jgi:magnesium transporter